MGATISSILYLEDPSQNEKKQSSYNKIFYTLNKISNTLDETEDMVKEIQISLNNPDMDVMEWDYFDTPILEYKNLPAFES